MKKSKHSKKFAETRSKIDQEKAYSIEQAIELMQSLTKAKFDESVEVHMRLGIDPKKSDQQIRSTVTLPHGTGKTKKVAAFVGADKEKEAKDAGADIVGGEDLIASIKQSGKCDFDIAIATPDMMRLMAPIAKILGPKGLMPSPKNDTITTDIKKTVSELKKGKVAFKNDETSNLHQAIGKISFDKEKLVDNFNAFLEAIKKIKPSASKGTYIKTLSICSTMGPSIKVELPK